MSKKTLFDSHPTVAWPPTTVAWPSVTNFKNFPNCLKRLTNVFWQLSYGRMTSDHCRVTFSNFFQNFSELLETSKKRCLTVIRRSRDLRPLSRDRSATFFKMFPNCLKRRKNVVRQSADGRVTTNHCCLTVQRLFSKFRHFGWIVAWPSGEFCPVVFANDFAYASWHMSLSFLLFFLSAEQLVHVSPLTGMVPS